MQEAENQNVAIVSKNDLQLLLDCAMDGIEAAKLCVSFQREKLSKGMNFGPTYPEEALQRAEQKIQQESEAIERLKQLLEHA